MTINKKKKLLRDEILFAISILKRYETKPVWRFTWEFPFIKKFYIFKPDDAKITIDWYAKKLKK
jgi:hypothetical protein